MARIEIENIPVEQDLTSDEQKQLAGGRHFLKIDGIDRGSTDRPDSKEAQVISFFAGRTNVSLNY